MRYDDTNIFTDVIRTKDYENAYDANMVREGSSVMEGPSPIQSQQFIVFFVGSHPEPYDPLRGFNSYSTIANTYSYRPEPSGLFEME